MHVDVQLDDGPQASRKWGKYFGYTVTGGGGTCICSAQDDPREVLIFFLVKVDCDERGFGSAFRTVDRSFSSRSLEHSERIFLFFFCVNFDALSAPVDTGSPHRRILSPLPRNLAPW